MSDSRLPPEEHASIGSKTSTGPAPSRRDLLTTSIWVSSSGMALGLGLPGALYLLTPVLRREGASWIDLGDADRLRPTAPREVRFYYEARVGYRQGRRPGRLYVVADAAAPGGLLVLRPVCTHLGCNVSWDQGAGLFVCPCHGGRYDAKGRVVAGPPPRPLERAGTEVREGRLYVEVGRAS